MSVEETAVERNQSVEKIQIQGNVSENSGFSNSSSMNYPFSLFLLRQKIWPRSGLDIILLSSVQSVPSGAGFQGV